MAYFLCVHYYFMSVQSLNVIAMRCMKYDCVKQIFIKITIINQERILVVESFSYLSVMEMSECEAKD